MASISELTEHGAGCAAKPSGEHHEGVTSEDDFARTLPSGFAAFGISLLPLARRGFFIRIAEIQLGVMALSLNDYRTLLQLPGLPEQW